MDGPNEPGVPPYNEARLVELTKLPDGGYDLTFIFGSPGGGDGPVDGPSRKMPMSATLTSDAEAIWEAEQELRDIFGQFPSRDDRQTPPTVATWTPG